MSSLGSPPSSSASPNKPVFNKRIRLNAYYAYPSSVNGISSVDRLLCTYTFPLWMLCGIYIMCLQFLGTPYYCPHLEPTIDPPTVDRMILENPRLVGTRHSNRITVPKHEDLVKFCAVSGQFVHNQSTFSITILQFVPVFMCMASITFTLPRVMYYSLLKLSGYPLLDVLFECQKVRRAVAGQEMDNTLQTLAFHLILVRKSFRSGHRHITAPVSTIYAAFKLMQFLVVSGNLAAIVVLLDFPLEKFFALLLDFTDVLTRGTPIFGLLSRVFKCGLFLPGGSGKFYRNVTLDCYAYVNVISERFFAIFIIWLTILSGVTFCSGFLFVCNFLSRSRRMNRILCVLQRTFPDVTLLEQQKRIHRFFRLIGSDTCLLLKLIAADGGELIATRFVAALWERFLDLERGPLLMTEVGMKSPAMSLIHFSSPQARYNHQAPAHQLPIVDGILADESNGSDENPGNAVVSALLHSVVQERENDNGSESSAVSLESLADKV